MRSSFAVFLRGFTLPFGATTGRRIVFDGVDGRISVFDSANEERIRIGGSGSESRILFETGDADQGEAAYISTTQAGAAGLKRYFLVVVSPSSDGSPANAAQISMRSENEGATIGPGITMEDGNGGRLAAVHLTTDELEVEDAQRTKLMGRQLIEEFQSTANSAAHGDLAVTDMVLNNLPVIAGHTYRFYLHTQTSITAVISQWILTLNVNGVVTDRFDTIFNQVASIKGSMTNAWCDWVAPTTQATDDFAVGVDEITATAATLTLQAAATVPRRLTVVDLGVLP